MASPGFTDPDRKTALAEQLRWRNALFSVLLALLPCIAAGDGFARAPTAKVEAAFLRNFAHYLTWPDHAFADSSTPWRVCILGDDEFRDVVAASLQGRKEQDRSFMVIAPGSQAELKSCHLAFVGHPTPEARRSVLATLSSLPILTIGEDPGFLDEGGIIRFQVTDHVDFGIDLDHARSASLKVPTKVLEVAQEVTENGIKRRRR